RIESPPTSAAWDARVASILLEGHDLDRSGWLDQNLEIQDIPCEALQEIERQVRSAADVGLATLYGVEDGLVWIGANLGFATEARDALGVRLLVCDVEVDVD
ncbi:MAG TPA: hypothetical protein PK095_13455, partial [Myxococcota bacterium]|nr:hypothetical protein [Myxococcota bacterium]